jgi:hypothetical protein
MSADADQVLARIAAWADPRADIAALVQLGSRVQPDGRADEWSDYDFHLITSRPRAYHDPECLRSIGDCWAVSAQNAFGNARKLTVILAGAAEADFVVLPVWGMRVAFGALRFPGTAPLWPGLLRRGLRDLGIIACPGWRVIKGGSAWEQRYQRLGRTVPWPPLDEARFQEIHAAFWTSAVWVAKKIARGEQRAAQREFHRTLVENTWLLLEQEARAAGRAVRPEARHAEQWLEPAQLAATVFASAADEAAMKRALLQSVLLFDEIAGRVAAARGWEKPGHAALKSWLLARCQ